MIAAVAGVHPAIPAADATADQLVVGDLLECEGWSCETDPAYAVARVIDGDGLKLNDFCLACLPGGAGWWARSTRWVSVLLPFDELAEQPIEVAS